MNANKDANVILKNSSGNIKNSGVIATGDKVIVTVGNETKEYEVVIYGDVNGDGNLDSIDFAMIKKSLLNQMTLSNSKREAADINKDGLIDSIDFAYLKKYLLGNKSIIKQ